MEFNYYNTVPTLQQGMGHMQDECTSKSLKHSMQCCRRSLMHINVYAWAIRHSCPELSPSNTYQLFGELSKEQFLVPLMTTEEVEGVTEVVTMATVLDLQGG